MNIHRSGSTPPTSSSAAAPANASLEQAQASQRHQEYLDEKKREQERAEKEQSILPQQQEAEEKSQAGSEAACAPTSSWEREIQEWAQIRAQAAERLQKYRLDREREQELADHDEHLPIPRQRQVAMSNSKLRMIQKWLN